ncbi:MAG: aspartate--tRNA ligase [Candidatus Wallbacteria bacterium HGW-Wallbacteria-1]|uniref:Aspartate--tRNA ligase n=1 Tax=Candidatus Wallbacteria bacterium HGW-Wallbacteria-1 TaxID=2013854 RepID=A0A2N1PLQ6_9BACT|nr:MAG: aspartate--tRNA ligase [Candidatus Wallbacteria bacterium HGW-Wallbacteria-1]
MEFHSLRGFKRTNYCGDLRASHIDNEVIVLGWVEKRRNLGSLIFINLRDRSGNCQVVVDTSRDEELTRIFKDIRSEYVVGFRGKVVKRSQEAINSDMATGEIEVVAEEVRLFNTAETTPFYIRDDLKCDETLRLRYRYLDLRRPKMQKYLMTRSRICMATREYFHKLGFLELETPVLTKSTPEGARDYLVPSRVHNGAFFALPQSPQIFKQLFMVAGFDRYFQIVKCFRDEDLRADRQPEFTQIDLEMSFVEEEDVMTTIEGLMARIYRDCQGLELNLPFPRMTYFEAMDKYGVDRPDTRFEMLLHDLTPVFASCEFAGFQTVLAEKGVVKGLCVKGGAEMSRKELDALSSFVKVYGAKGVAWFQVKDGEIKSPISKFLTPEEIESTRAAVNAEVGDLIVLVADIPSVANAALGALRLDVARKKGLIPSEEFDAARPDLANYKFLWITDFPLFEYDPEEDRLIARHHPFTSPKEDDIPLMDGDMKANPDLVRARAYDLILNGSEIGGGSIRIHYQELQQKMFAALGLSEEETRAKFGFLLDAFQYGAPPHGGLALGLDRILMTMLNTDSIRDMIPFPKTQQAQCLMTDAPSDVAEEQLRELGIEIRS